MADILVVYHYNNGYEFPVRATLRDHLLSFGRYAPHRCCYLNLEYQGVPDYIARMKFDLIIFHTTFLSTRWTLSLFERLMKVAERLQQMEAIKVAIPQDEFIRTDMLCDFINAFRINYVFSIFPESEWPKIYHKVDLHRTRMFKILAGYLDERTLQRIRRLARKTKRCLDVGYRAQHNAPWLGRHGLLKVKVADLFQQRARDRGLRVDISTKPEDKFLGDEWYKFLLRCRYTIGVPGGSSILDRDGSLKVKTEDYLASCPSASFEEVERACFPGKDGSLLAAVITPRHLEACATKTCQVLIEGEYDGVLKPGIHYIELKQDFSNLDQVIDLIHQDSRRETLVANAYRDIVESKRYTYRDMVQFILEKALKGVKNEKALSVTNRVRGEVLHFRIRWTDRFDWLRIALIWRRMRTWQEIRACLHAWLPPSYILLLRKALGITGEYQRNRRYNHSLESKGR